MLEGASETQTLKSLKTGYTSGRNMMLNACEIRASYDIPNYNMQHPIQIDARIMLVDK